MQPSSDISSNISGLDLATSFSSPPVVGPGYPAPSSNNEIKKLESRIHVSVHDSVRKLKEEIKSEIKSLKDFTSEMARELKDELKAIVKEFEFATRDEVTSALQSQNDVITDHDNTIKELRKEVAELRNESVQTKLAFSQMQEDLGDLKLKLSGFEKRQRNIDYLTTDLLVLRKSLEKENNSWWRRLFRLTSKKQHKIQFIDSLIERINQFDYSKSNSNDELKKELDAVQKKVMTRYKDVFDGRHSRTFIEYKNLQRKLTDQTTSQASIGKRS